MIQLFTWWKNLAPIPFTIHSTWLSIIISMPFAMALELLGVSEDQVGGPFDILQEIGIPATIFLAVVIAPIIETFICQMIPIRLIYLFKGRYNMVLALLVSSVFFAAGHAGYSFWYALLIFPMGLILGYAYILWYEKNGPAFLVTTGIHALRNGLALAALYGTA